MNIKITYMYNITRHLYYNVIKKSGALIHKIMKVFTIENFFLYFGNLQCLIANFFIYKKQKASRRGIIIYAGQPRGLSKIISQMKYFNKYFDIYITAESSEIQDVSIILAKMNLNIKVIEVDVPIDDLNSTGMGAFQYYKYKIALNSVRLTQCHQPDHHRVILRHRTDYYLWFPVLLPFVVKFWKPGEIYCNGDQCFGGLKSTMLQMCDLWNYSVSNSPWKATNNFDVRKKQIIASDDVFCWWFINFPSDVIDTTEVKMSPRYLKKRIMTLPEVSFCDDWSCTTIMKYSKGFPSQKVFALFINQKNIIARFSLLWFGTLMENRKNK